jgi:hypothetical protein
MRHLILVLSPISLLACYSAYAQGYAQPSAPPGARPPPPAYQAPPASRGGQASGWVTRPPDPENCGTPDEPRPCPPMPRHPLKYFPANRQKVTG